MIQTGPRDVAWQLNFSYRPSTSRNKTAWILIVNEDILRVKQNHGNIDVGKIVEKLKVVDAVRPVHEN